ncbi:hypothetical protein [Sphingosinicella sp. CPCC 101087]|uniref:hypothetical protein n=1 Tax=Sphingosinicella sp. CPCC 101087 TaxID=2497754 RepID=UPI0013ED7DD6|nr:hypothetical protein [Sphingosinicella sp. CPCC 101087]
MPAIRIPPDLEVEPDELLRFGLGGGTEGEIEATQQQRLDGWLDRRILLHVRVPF